MEEQEQKGNQPTGLLRVLLEILFYLGAVAAAIGAATGGNKFVEIIGIMMLAILTSIGVLGIIKWLREHREKTVKLPQEVIKNITGILIGWVLLLMVLLLIIYLRPILALTIISAAIIATILVCVFSHRFRKFAKRRAIITSVSWAFLLIGYTVMYLVVCLAPGSLSLEISEDVYTRADTAEFVIVVKSDSWRSQLFPASVIPVKLRIISRHGQICPVGPDDLAREPDLVVTKYLSCATRIEYHFEPGFNSAYADVYVFGINDDVSNVSSAREMRPVSFVKVP